MEGTTSGDRLFLCAQLALEFGLSEFLITKMRTVMKPSTQEF